MRIILSFIFVLSFSNIFSQGFFVGTTVEIAPYGSGYIQGTYEIKEKWARIQVKVLTNLDETKLNLKAGFNVWKSEDKELEIWLDLPYLNGTLIPNKGYNTPVELFEFQYKNSVAISLDIYRNSFVVNFGIRKKL